MTELDISAQDATSLAATLASVLGTEEAARGLRISLSDAELLRKGRSDEAGLKDTLADRVSGWFRVHYADFFKAAGRPVPPFNHLEGFWENFYQGPQAHPVVRHQRSTRPVQFLDFALNFPFGVPACALTPHSSYIDYFARQGYDLLTYKTVRDRPWRAHPFPQWAIAVDAPESVDPLQLERPVTASLDPGMEPTGLVNSFGVPSLKPQEWQEDVQQAKRLLQPGQVLIVSVMGTPEEARDDSELAQQFARTAALAVEAGADIVEANLSCPNTGGELICASASVSEMVLRSIARELTPSRTPLFAKISYLPPDPLADFVRRCGGYVQGIVGINTVSVPVVGRDGKRFFEGRARAGLSGRPILPLGLDVCKRLVDLRDQHFHRTDWVIVGVGGVGSASDFEKYMDLGADAVQSCSGAWLNPLLALEIQGLAPSEGALVNAQEPEVVALQSAVLSALAKAGPSHVVDIALAAQLSPSEARRAVDGLIEVGWVTSERDVLSVTPAGLAGFRNVRRTGFSTRPTGALSADEALDHVIAGLRTR